MNMFIPHILNEERIQAPSKYFKAIVEETDSSANTVTVTSVVPLTENFFLFSYKGVNIIATYEDGGWAIYHAETGLPLLSLSSHISSLSFAISEGITSIKIAPMYQVIDAIKREEEKIIPYRSNVPFDYPKPMTLKYRTEKQLLEDLKLESFLSIDRVREEARTLLPDYNRIMTELSLERNTYALIRVAKKYKELQSFVTDSANKVERPFHVLSDPSCLKDIINNRKDLYDSLFPVSTREFMGMIKDYSLDKLLPFIERLTYSQSIYLLSVLTDWGKFIPYFNGNYSKEEYVFRYKAIAGLLIGVTNKRDLYSGLLTKLNMMKWLYSFYGHAGMRKTFYNTVRESDIRILKSNKYYYTVPSRSDEVVFYGGLQSNRTGIPILIPVDTQKAKLATYKGVEFVVAEEECPPVQLYDVKQLYNIKKENVIQNKFFVFTRKGGVLVAKQYASSLTKFLEKINSGSIIEEKKLDIIKNKVDLYKSRIDYFCAKQEKREARVQ